MEYPFFDFPFYHHSSDLDLKRIYPIGSIIFRSSPLADKTVWTDVSLFDSHFYVNWEDMIWELIVSIKPSDLENPFGPWVDFHSEVHTIRNVRLQYSRTEEELERGVCTATMVIDGQNQGTFNLETFTGENYHKLTGNELPSHYHLYGTPKWLYSEATGTGTWMYGNDGVSPNFNRITSSTGGNQAHNNKEQAYNLFMYKRIA